MLPGLAMSALQASPVLSWCIPFSMSSSLLHGTKNLLQAHLLLYLSHTWNKWFFQGSLDCFNGRWYADAPICVPAGWRSHEHFAILWGWIFLDDTHVVRPVRPTVLACCYTSSAGACSLGLRSRCVEHQETCKISNGGAGGEKGGETQIWTEHKD